MLLRTGIGSAPRIFLSRFFPPSFALSLFPPLSLSFPSFLSLSFSFFLSLSLSLFLSPLLFSDFNPSQRVPYNMKCPASYDYYRLLFRALISHS